MQLVIDSYGARLRSRDGCLRIETADKVTELSPRQVTSVVVGPAASFSSDVVALCLRHNIDILLLDRHGEPVGRFWHANIGATAAIRRAQLAAAEGELGTEIAVGLVVERIASQRRLLQTLLRTRAGKAGQYESQLGELASLAEAAAGCRGPGEGLRGTLMGYEGRAGRVYFGALSELLPEQWRFDGRSRNPARDGFNCMLNYANAVMYGHVEKACAMAGLDPCIGFLHCDGWGRRSLTYDLVERYRCWSEQVCFRLFSSRAALTDHFAPVPGGCALEAGGRGVLLDALQEWLDTAEDHDGRRIRRRHRVLRDCHALARRLTGALEKEVEVRSV